MVHYFHIQNEKVGVNGENFQCYSYGASIWNSRKPWFLENAVVDILNRSTTTAP